MGTVLYHRTTRQITQSIIQDGFRDGVGNYLTESTYAGVWFSDMPLDVNEGAKGDTLVRVTLDLSGEELLKYQWIEEGKLYREWLIPAVVVRKALRNIDVVER
jgi:hypothetical protein